MVHRWFRLPAARAQGANTYFRGGRTCVRPDKQARRKVCTSATVRWPEVRSLQSIPRILFLPRIARRPRRARTPPRLPSRRPVNPTLAPRPTSIRLAASLHSPVPAERPDYRPRMCRSCAVRGGRSFAHEALFYTGLPRHAAAFVGDDCGDGDGGFSGARFGRARSEATSAAPPPPRRASWCGLTAPVRLGGGNTRACDPRGTARSPRG